MPDDVRLLCKRFETSVYPEKSFCCVRTSPFGDLRDVVIWDNLKIFNYTISVEVKASARNCFNFKGAVVGQVRPTPDVQVRSWVAKNITGSFRCDIVNQRDEATGVSVAAVADLFKADLETLGVNDRLAG